VRRRPTIAAVSSALSIAGSVALVALIVVPVAMLVFVVVCGANGTACFGG
jgi:hypothetical protein